MKPRVGRIVSGAVVALALLLPAAAGAQTAIPGRMRTGDLPSGAKSMICVPPAGWNGQLVVFAPGYVGPGQPLIAFYHLTLGGVHLPALVLSQGFAFATTSYRQNGLAILEGADDIRELVDGVHGRARPAAANLYHWRIRRRAGRGTAARTVSGPVLVRARRVQPGGQLPWPGQLRRRLQGAVRLLLSRTSSPGTVVDVPADVVDGLVRSLCCRRSLGASGQSRTRARADAHVRRRLRSRQSVATIGQTAAQRAHVQRVRRVPMPRAKLGGNPYGNQTASVFRLLERPAPEPSRRALRGVAGCGREHDEVRDDAAACTRPLITLHTTGRRDGAVLARAALPGEGAPVGPQRPAAAAGRPLRPLQLHHRTSC